MTRVVTYTELIERADQPKPPSTQNRGNFRFWWHLLSNLDRFGGTNKPPLIIVLVIRADGKYQIDVTTDLDALALGVGLGANSATLACTLATMQKSSLNKRLTVLLAVFLLLGWTQHRRWYRTRVSLPCSLAIALVGLYWFLQRIVEPYP